jgi:GNAT superfamily N-acetyltransferase
VQALVERAVASDAAEILRLRREAEDWLDAQGIEQWGRGHVDLAQIARQVQQGQWQVLRRQAGLCGALRLLWSDEALWLTDDCFAAYVHGMVIDRAKAGQGLGASLLRWVEAQAVVAAAPYLRLDCVEGNERLRAYYKAQGFTPVGRRDFDPPWFSVALLQKSVSSERTTQFDGATGSLRAHPVEQSQ